MRGSSVGQNLRLVRDRLGVCIPTFWSRSGRGSATFAFGRRVHRFFAAPGWRNPLALASYGRPGFDVFAAQPRSKKGPLISTAAPQLSRVTLSQ